MRNKARLILVAGIGMTSGLDKSFLSVAFNSSLIHQGSNKLMNKDCGQKKIVVKDINKRRQAELKGLAHFKARKKHA